ncbi:MAG: hypothetical protein JSU63_03355 [Phycisphaerales bacterium]|nr:MAG: hypothetical protein JSU63_03355 [Phycisphaerales bacterium]
MKPEQDIAVKQPARKDSPFARSAREPQLWTSSKSVSDLLQSLPDKPARCVARAPGRLDVMGGIAEYTGALVLTLPIAEHSYVVVQLRNDDTIVVDPTGKGSSDGHRPTVFEISQLYTAKGVPVDADGARKQAAGLDETTWCVLGALLEALRSGVIPELSGGLSVAVGSAGGSAGDSARGSGLAGATLAAVASACDLTLDPQSAVAVCQRVENDWLDWPIGAADAVCVLNGEPDALMQLQCDSYNIAGATMLPDELAIIGIDCGNCREDAREKYRRVRTATFMGQLLVDRIINYDGGNCQWWDGHLSRISVNDFVERFRDRIPTRMKGKDFVGRFGETGDALTMIDPDYVYKIRSRTEHHIYEHARARQFVECLSRAARTGDDRALVEAGELMYGSHWSYGQRCGLGDVRTDAVVSLLRGRGVENDIYGAKISGRGCGGFVAVFMRATDRAMSAVEDALQALQAKTGHQTGVIRSSCAGVLLTGAQQL